MGKHVVYLRKRDENELKAAGLDPGEWVRSEIKKALGDLRRPATHRAEIIDRKDTK